MGCLQSKQVQGDGSTFAGGLQSEKFDHDSSSMHSQKTAPVKTSSQSASRSAPQKNSSQGGSRETSCMLSDVLSDQNIEWKLDVEDIESRATFKTLESIKDMACEETGVAKSRICLFDINLVQFMTTTGAFAPAMPLGGSIIGQQFDDFQSKNATELVLDVDMRKHPIFKDHPAVTQRPHCITYAGKLLITENSHPLGLLFVWDSKAGPSLSKKQEERFAELAEEATEVLQGSMLRGIGATTTSKKGSSNGTADNNSPGKRQLASVWIDFDDPEWRVVGINKEWEKLTGVGLDTFSDHPGLLSIMIPSDGSDKEALRLGFKNAAANPELRTGASLPAILSPRASSGGSLQFAMALKKASGPPPMRLCEDNNASVETKDANIWVVEVHARVQADVHMGDFSSADLISILGLTSESGSEGSLHNTAGSANMSGSLSIGTPVGVQAPRIPPRLASLKLGKLIGSGSYANVYAGYLGSRPVAVKVMHHNHGPDSFKNEWTSNYEALMTVDISHDNVVTTLDWCKIEDARGFEVWIVQELCELGSLSAALQANHLFGNHNTPPAGTSPEDYSTTTLKNYKVVLQTAREIARGMRYLHSVDEMHGDLSSNNVLLAHGDNSRGFVAKVTDFGLSRASKDDVTTKTVGTVSHMPPELLLEGLMTKSGDVYSFGVLLWELWTGKRAWDKMSQAQVIFAVTCRNEFLHMPDDAPPEYAALATQCMSPNRNKRPSFNEIVPRIDSMLAELPGLQTSASGSSFKNNSK